MYTRKPKGPKPDVSEIFPKKSYSVFKNKIINPISIYLRVISTNEILDRYKLIIRLTKYEINFFIPRSKNLENVLIISQDDFENLLYKIFKDSEGKILVKEGVPQKNQ